MMHRCGAICHHLLMSRFSYKYEKRLWLQNFTKAIIFITRIRNNYKKHVCLLAVEHNLTVTIHSKLNLNKQRKSTTLIGMVSRSPLLDVPVNSYQTVINPSSVALISWVIIVIYEDVILLRNQVSLAFLVVGVGLLE